MMFEAIAIDKPGSSHTPENLLFELSSPSLVPLVHIG